ncbi:MAG TPA: metallophosphoesterase [Gemmatimonadaceae bacterium]|nr:metallophosphoesterase [Gemmatimonadaceae bacterium]
MIRLLHASDLHFGVPSIPAQVEALEAIISRERFDAIVLSGDISQRSRKHEFARGKRFIEHAERFAPVMVVPGNHDVAWWTDPMGLGSHDAMYSRYRRYIRSELEPVMRLSGLTLVGLNSAHGIQPYTLTLRPRDLAVVGSLREHQWSRAALEFATAPARDLKVLVVHHNLTRGHISDRWGLANRERGLARAAATGADLVLCGHDHEESAEEVEAEGRKFVVATASTLTERVRGGVPSSLNIIEADAATVTVAGWEWTDGQRRFTPARSSRFAR